MTVATGWNTTTGLDYVMYRRELNTTTGLYQEISGTRIEGRATLTGSTLSNMTFDAGTEPAAGYAADGNTVVLCAATAQWADDLVGGILAQHKQTGAHSDITTDSITNAGNYAQSAGTFTVPNNAITGAALATSTIKLGYAQVTSAFTTTSTTATQATGLTASVTIPAGGRGVKITAFTSFLTSSGGAALVTMSIWDGVVNSGTLLAEALTANAAASQGGNGTCIAFVTPAAGAKTYNVGLKVGSNTGQITASATSPAFILVQLI